MVRVSVAVESLSLRCGVTVSRRGDCLARLARVDARALPSNHPSPSRAGPAGCRPGSTPSDMAGRGSRAGSPPAATLPLGGAPSATLGASSPGGLRCERRDNGNTHGRRNRTATRRALVVRPAGRSAAPALVLVLPALALAVRLGAQRCPEGALPAATHAARGRRP